MTATTKVPVCAACDRPQTEVPLISLAYLNTTLWICPQHLPVLIHNPQMLTGRIPGAENMKAADHQD